MTIISLFGLAAESLQILSFQAFALVEVLQEDLSLAPRINDQIFLIEIQCSTEITRSHLQGRNEDLRERRKVIGTLTLMRTSYISGVKGA